MQASYCIQMGLCLCAAVPFTRTKVPALPCCLCDADHIVIKEIQEKWKISEKGNWEREGERYSIGRWASLPGIKRINSKKRSLRRTERSSCPTLPSHRLAIHAPAEAPLPPWPVSTRKHKNNSESASKVHSCVYMGIKSVRSEKNDRKLWMATLNLARTRTHSQNETHKHFVYLFNVWFPSPTA